MSMFVLNSILSERYPTVMDGLMYTFPFDGEMHCCINNMKYAKVLSIKNGDSKLYTYFTNKGSVITNSVIDLEKNDLNIAEGKYNLIIVDSDVKLSDTVMTNIKKASSSSKTPALINSKNATDTYFNYGGSYCYIDSNIDEYNIKDAITKGALYDSRFNAEIAQDSLKLNDGYIQIPWDNRVSNFSISLDVKIESYVDNIGIACIANNNNALLSILYNAKNNRFIIKEETTEIALDMHKEMIFKEKFKITITKGENTLNIYINEELILSTYINISTKGNKLIIGKNNIANIDNSAILKISNLSIYDKKLSKEEVVTLSKGRLIFA